MPPQNQVPPQNNFSPDSLTKNPKFMVTLKTFAIYIPILMVVNFVVGIATSSFSYGGFSMGMFAFPALVMAVITGVISGVIGGAIFYFIYDPVRNWVKGNSFLSGYIHNMFTLLWIPSLVGTVVSGALGLLSLMSIGSQFGAYGMANTGGVFIGVIISLAVNLFIYYFYAKAISAKLEPMYPW